MATSQNTTEGLTVINGLLDGNVNIQAKLEGQAAFVTVNVNTQEKGFIEKTALILATRQLAAKLYGHTAIQAAKMSSSFVLETNQMAFCGSALLAAQCPFMAPLVEVTEIVLRSPFMVTEARKCMVEVCEIASLAKERITAVTVIAARATEEALTVVVNRAKLVEKVAARTTVVQVAKEAREQDVQGKIVHSLGSLPRK